MLASAVVLGLVGGLASGGRVQRLRSFAIGWPLLLVGSAALRLLAPFVGDLAAAAYILAFAGIVAVALRNASITGMVLVAGGAALNLIVVVANGAMPVGVDALEIAGALMPTDPLHTPLTADVRLSVLADVIPAPPLRAVYSVGDVLLAAGGAVVAFRATRT